MELLKAKVLVVNKQWQGYEETDVATALCDLCRGAATAIDTHGSGASDRWAKLVGSHAVPSSMPL